MQHANPNEQHRNMHVSERQKTAKRERERETDWDGLDQKKGSGTERLVRSQIR